MDIKVTPVFETIWDNDARIAVLQGGTRSSKTYSIVQYLIIKALESPKKITIVRKALATINKTVGEDFLEIMREMNLYSKDHHNKSDNVYRFPNGSIIDFLGCDDPQKLRGNKRDILYCNEANELSWEDFFQLLMRTSGNIYLDFNPSDDYHWIYDNLLTRDDVKLLKSTYKDNPFLSDIQVKEIERLRDTDEDYWRVYGLGERGKSKATIFTFLEAEVPESAKFLSYGMDFGFTNDPTTLVAVYGDDHSLYAKELIYETGLTNRDISEKMKALGVDRRAEIFADSAEPKSIEELYRMGWNIKPTKKGADSINAGIDVLKRYKLHITGHNFVKEMRNYKWVEDKNGKLLNKPIDAFNHAIDAFRYATYNKLTRPNYGRYAVR